MGELVHGRENLGVDVAGEVGLDRLEEMDERTELDFFLPAGSSLPSNRMSRRSLPKGSRGSNARIFLRVDASSVVVVSSVLAGSNGNGATSAVTPSMLPKRNCGT